MNYFSGWIANLGVVPLFLFAAFLFFPDLTFLAALLFFVTRVFETIYPLQFSTSAVQFSIRNKVLPSQSCTVKIFLLISVSCHIHPAFAKAQVTEKTTIILSKGQHHQIKFDGFSNYSVTNKDTISHKLSPSEGLLFIKGKKLGFAEVILWKSKSRKKVFKIYVLHKNRHLKIVQLGEVFEQMGLDIKLVGPILKVSGEIKELPIYRKVKQILKKNKDHIISKMRISRFLKSIILSEVYSNFLNRYIDSIDCKIQFLDVECNYSNHSNLKITKSLKEKYFISFNNLGIENRNSNIRLTFDIKRISISTNKQINPGLNRYQGKLKTLINNDFKSPLLSNSFNLNGLKGHLVTVAKPSILIIPGERSEISVGSSIPFNQGEEKGTGFKFAGLKIETNVIPKGKNFLCEFSIMLSKPNSTNSLSFQENKQTSKVILPLNEKVNVLNIEFNSNSTDEEMIPVLSRVPILGRLFTSHSVGSSLQRIIAYVHVERM